MQEKHELTTRDGGGTTMALEKREPIQTIVVTMKNGTRVDIQPGMGGTLNAPVEHTDGLGSYDAPDGNGVFLVGTKPAYHDSGRSGYVLLKEVRVFGGQHLPYPDSQPHYGPDGGTELLPDDWRLRHATTTPHIPGTRDGYALRGGDLIWVPFHGAGFGVPTDDVRKNLAAIVDKTTAWGEVDDWPRMKHLVGLFGWGEDEGLYGPGGGRDVGWLIRNWHTRTGGAQQRGYFASMNPRWGDGFDNGHYNALAYHAMNWVNTGRAEDWFLFIGMAIHHCTQGRVHKGKYKGMAHYEKGMGLPGDYFAPSFAKQFGLNLIMPWLATNQHPFFQQFVDEYHEALESWTVDKVWNGAWGCRIMARFLEDALLFWALFKSSTILTTMKASIPHCLNLLDAKGYWKNHQDGRYPASPWMNSQLATILFKIGETVGWEKKEHREAVLDAMQSILDLGTTTYETSEQVYAGSLYRMDGAQVAMGHPSLTSFIVPMLRILAEERPDGEWNPQVELATSAAKFGAVAYPDALDMFKETAYGRWGAGWGDIDNPPPLDTVGMEYHRQGVGGFPKVNKFTLQSFVT